MKLFIFNAVVHCIKMKIVLAVKPSHVRIVQQNFSQNSSAPTCDFIFAGDCFDLRCKNDRVRLFWHYALIVISFIFGKNDIFPMKQAINKQ